MWMSVYVHHLWLLVVTSVTSVMTDLVWWTDDLGSTAENEEWASEKDRRHHLPSSLLSFQPLSAIALLCLTQFVSVAVFLWRKPLDSFTNWLTTTTTIIIIVTPFWCRISVWYDSFTTCAVSQSVGRFVLPSWTRWLTDRRKSWKNLFYVGQTNKNDVLKSKQNMIY